MKAEWSREQDTIKPRTRTGLRAAVAVPNNRLRGRAATAITFAAIGREDHVFDRLQECTAAPDAQPPGRCSSLCRFKVQGEEHFNSQTWNIEQHRPFGPLMLEPEPVLNPSITQTRSLTTATVMSREQRTRGSMLGLVALGMFLVSGGSPVQACSCGPSHPQQNYCGSDVVIKAKIVSRELHSDDMSQWIRYEIQQQKMFKGLEKVEEIREVFTPYSDMLCGMVLPQEEMNKHYVLSGNLDREGKLYIYLCGFNRPWAQLTSGQRAGLNGRYAASCQCVVKPCQSLPCMLTSDEQCLWTDGLLVGDWAGIQAQRFSCSPLPSGPCNWEALKSHMGQRKGERE